MECYLNDKGNLFYQSWEPPRVWNQLLSITFRQRRCQQIQ
jgi:hypothetical protein